MFRDKIKTKERI